MGHEYRGAFIHPSERFHHLVPEAPADRAVSGGGVLLHPVATAPSAWGASHGSVSRGRRDAIRPCSRNSR